MPKPRARELGVPFDGKPGPLNAITDVGGVEVGHCTLIVDRPKAERGKGPVRTGVTAILPRGKRQSFDNPVFAGISSLNSWGEMTGYFGVEEWGLMYGPFLMTGTKSVGVVHDAVYEYAVANNLNGPPLPIVAETADFFLNDWDGFHVRKEHAFEALESATSGPVPEGNVGGGTGMVCHEFKGGIGTSSRAVRVADRDYHIGVLVQANYGKGRLLKIAGVPVGQEIPVGIQMNQDKSSIIIAIATDLPLLPHQLKRLARRAPLALGRMGSIASNSSGDIFLAFSTANVGVGNSEGITDLKMASSTDVISNAIFEATIQSIEESIVNALIAAETMVGFYGTVKALPHDLLVQTLQKYNRLRNP